MAEIGKQTVRSLGRIIGLPGFLGHAAFFAATLAIATALGFDWEYFWPLLGWSFGLALHGLAVIATLFISLGRKDDAAAEPLQVSKAT